MPRRVSLPGADELFRSTATPKTLVPANPEEPGSSSGRVRHDEKITIYVTATELLAVEQARLKLRSELGKNVDRGRMVRAVLALALADLDEHGMDSALAQRLRDQ
ncbi:MAG: hypothetical protein H7288_18605 [Kineosporiaceae bacterium]|nr:hypothetical protein [Aeromicrobium sp.]